MSLECKLNFELIGTLIAIAIYNSVLLDLPLPHVVYKKLLDELVNLEDIREFEPQMYTTFSNILKSDNVSAMDLTFSVTYDNYGMLEIVDLIPYGRNIEVT